MAKYRTLFLSDLHIGSHKCQDLRLVNFLSNNDAEMIYLIGDIFDGCFSRTWPPLHYYILQLFIDKIQKGTRIIVVPGNHDAFLRKHNGVYSSKLYIVNQIVHTINGREFLITHGDETDMIRFHFLLRWITKIEKWIGWHLWEILRKNIGTIIRIHTRAFENKMRKLAQDYSGVICGHIHSPELLDADDFIYANCGDFTYHCSALAEHMDGRLELLYG